MEALAPSATRRDLGDRPVDGPEETGLAVDATSGGEQRGRDNFKNVDGRKRHIVVDSMGLLLAVLVTAADARAAPALFARPQGQPMGKVVRMYADNWLRLGTFDERLASFWKSTKVRLRAKI